MSQNGPFLWRLPINLPSHRDRFERKCHNQLNARVLQLISCKSKAPGFTSSRHCIHDKWTESKSGVGISLGFVLIDFEKLVPVYYRCNFNPYDLTGAKLSNPTSAIMWVIYYKSMYILNLCKICIRNYREMFISFPKLCHHNIPL